jgi:hypothetical protein|eukprot:SAG25_NODE_205_length_11932_cov_40.485760_6_plen_41_part_00
MTGSMAQPIGMLPRLALAQAAPNSESTMRGVSPSFVTKVR